jgi:hypothetical protein
MNKTPDFARLCDDIKQLSGLTAQDEAVLRELAPMIVPSLEGLTDRVFGMLGTMPRTAAFVEGRADVLRQVQGAWLNGLFTRKLDGDYARWLYQIAAAHAREKVPQDFMCACMTMFLRELLLLVWAAPLASEAKARAGVAINSACAFSRMIIQRSYDDSGEASVSVSKRMISDISDKLFDKMAGIYEAYADHAREFANAHRVDIRPRRRGRHVTRTESSQCMRRLSRSYS